MHKSPLYFPGGKARFWPKVRIPLVFSDSRQRYVEPFWGGGGVGLNEMLDRRMQQFWLNDLDVGVFCFWQSLKDSPNALKAMIRAYRPKPEHFSYLKEYFADGTLRPVDKADIVRIGFFKFLIHQISYSGLGVKAGTVRGGSSQFHSAVDARWAPERTCAQIDCWSAVFAHSDVRVTNLDWSHVVSDESVPSFLYLDPPYYGCGQRLYQHSFADEDHHRLAKALTETRHLWALSYNDCPKVRALYSWAAISELETRYAVCGFKRKKELLIAPDRRLLMHIDSQTMKAGFQNGKHLPEVPLALHERRTCGHPLC
jgi:DNA adenine methylase